MQSQDMYSAKLKKSELRTADNALSPASKEFVTRLLRYREHLNSAKNSADIAKSKVYEGFSPPKSNSSVASSQRAALRGLVEHYAPLIDKIIETEKLWLHNICAAHESAENALEENKALYESRQELRSTLLKLPPQDVIEKNLERLISQKETISNWRAGRQRVLKLQEVQTKIDNAVQRKQKAEASVSELSRFNDLEYFEGLRLYLRGAGFIVSPSYLPPSAVFPEKDWIVTEAEQEHGLTREKLAARADELMKKYQMLGAPYSGIHYKDDSRNSEIGCVCVSWVRVALKTKEQHAFVPVLGFSGKAPVKPVGSNKSLEAVLGACALPPFWSSADTHFDSSRDPHGDATLDEKPQLFNNYYDEIMTRANNLSINYRVRTILKLRLPSRQAMLSYLGLNFTVKEKKVDERPLSAPTPGITRWHSLNCAEPAALAWISSFFVDGQDVHLCCPYEGGDDAGFLGLKPKETCPWCATVEVAYRSLKKSNKDGWDRVYETGMTTGAWPREITLADEFTADDLNSRLDLPRNREDFALAYPPSVNRDVAVLRKIFKELELLTKDTIRECKPALWE